MKKVLLAILVLALCTTSCALAMTDEEWRAQSNAAQAVCVEGLSQEEFDALETTTIIKDPDSITGYTVTFRYKDAEAGRVRIRGEWSLANRHAITTDGIVYHDPEDWQIGDFAMIHDYQGNWAHYDMEKNEATGVWSYTIPLPSGTWSYRFIVGGAADAELTDYTDAVQTTDPGNRPFEDFEGAQNNSQVRVPFDAATQVEDLSLQLPNPDGHNGIADIVYYRMPEDETDYELCVYTPYGYDAKRAEPYKVLYISHGNGVESATSWYNKGSVAYMMDNLIAQERIEPFVLVIINNYMVANTLGEYDVDNLINNIMPYVEENYNVSDQAEGRAVAGLSRGGRFTVETLLMYPDAANYYGLFSAGLGAHTILKDLDRNALSDAHILIHYGTQELCDPDRSQARHQMMADFSARGQAYSFQTYQGGHQWTVWRQGFVDFCEMVLWK